MTGLEILALRKALGLTQVQFARRLHVSPLAVVRWETGKNHPNQNSHARLAALATKTKRLERRQL